MKYFLLLLTFLGACSEIKVVNSSHRLVSVGAKKEEWKSKNFSAELKRHFYFFGFYPDYQEIDLADVATSVGSKNLVIEKMEDTRTGTDYAWSIISFGLYVPRTFKFKGYSITQ